MPAASAACGFSPTARSLRPVEVRAKNQATAPKIGSVSHTIAFCTNNLPTPGSSDSGHSAIAPMPSVAWLVQSAMEPTSAVSPWQKNTSASPAITWFTRSQITITANSTETRLAASIASTSDTAGWPSAICAPMPASAPTSISPSAPSESTPARSQMMRPSAASA
jgi:hypothetical protein